MGRHFDPQGTSGNEGTFLVVETEGVGAAGIQRVEAGVLSTPTRPLGASPGPALTLAGCLPLPVLGVGLVQVGEAGPQLQDAV